MLIMKKRKKLTAQETARELTKILLEHLSELPPKEREKKIKAGQKVMASRRANAPGVSSVSDNHATTSKISRTFPAPRAARGR